VIRGRPDHSTDSLVSSWDRRVDRLRHGWLPFIIRLVVGGRLSAFGLLLTNSFWLVLSSLDCSSAALPVVDVVADVFLSSPVVRRVERIALSSPRIRQVRHASFHPIPSSVHHGCPSHVY